MKTLRKLKFCFKYKWAFVVLVGLVVVGGVAGSVTYGVQKSMTKKESDKTIKEKFTLLK